MALANLKTGQTISDMKNSAEKESLISQQAIQIYSLTSQNSQLAEENISLKKKLSVQSNQTSIIESLKEKLSDSEKMREDAELRLGNVKADLEREKGKPPKVEYSFGNKCRYCVQAEHERALFQMEDDIKSAAADRKKAAQELAEAEKIRSDREESIRERVDKLVKAKTKPERLKAWFVAIRSGFNVFMITVPLIYAAAITIISMIRNEIVRNDIVSAGKAVGHFFVWLFTTIINLIKSAAGVANKISNELLSHIVRGLIVFLLAALVFAVFGGILFGLYKLIRYLVKYHSEKFGLVFLSVLLADLGIMVFLGDMIRSVLEINLCLLFMIILAGYFFVIYALPEIIPWVLEKIEYFGRSL